MKKRVSVILLLVFMSVSILAAELSFESYGAYFTDIKGNLLFGQKVSKNQGPTTNSLSFAGFGSSNELSLGWPANYLLSYEYESFLFFPGLGFVKSDLSLFYQRDRVDQQSGFGGSVDAYGSLANVAMQLKLLRLPQEYFSKAFEFIEDMEIGTEDPFFVMYRPSEGVTAYTRFLYKLYPNNAFEVGYLGNFSNNNENSLWFNWIVPEFMNGMVSFGIGLENGEASFVPKGLFGGFSYTAPVNELLYFESSFRYGSLQSKTGVLSFDPQLASRIRLIFDTDKSDLIFVISLDTMTGDSKAGFGQLQWKLQYSPKETLPVSLYITKENSREFGVGVNYQF